jgi:AcrR family transcriptional regulator
MRPNKRDELVQKALEAFNNHGFQATGMDRLVLETGISKTSMYKHFSSKDDLILAVLELRDTQFRNWLIERMQALGDTPIARILALYDVLEEWFAKSDFKGCMFIRAAAEFQDKTHPVRQQSATHKQRIEDLLKGLAEEAGLKNPALLARQLVLLKEGAIIAAHVQQSPTAAADAKAAARVLLGQ